MAHKAGFVNIIGKPNVGKSTLMNILVGENLSVINPKAQTTRHRIIGIVNGEDHQIVFSDTPGILKPNYKLQEYMMKFVEAAMLDADIYLVVVEVGEKLLDENLIEQLNKSKLPVILLINKVDLSEQKIVEDRVTFWRETLPESYVLPISALHNFNLDLVLKKIVELLPESEPYYSKDELTDKNVRFFVTEIIREKILRNYQKEVPYSVEVVVDEYKEEKMIDRIYATIYVSRESQKIIIIGEGGKAIKRVGIEARKEIEKMVSKKVYLDLSVKVSKDWRDNDLQLKRFGYDVSD